MNVLVASCGTRNKIIQYLKTELGSEGKVIATDASPYAPALYEADKQVVVPRITEPGYIEMIFDICKKENIQGIFSLIDPELSLLAEHAAQFRELGVMVIGSSYELCELSLNKWEMFRWLTAHGYRCAASYMDRNAFFADVEAGKIQYPVFVKPAKGSASIAIAKAEDAETVNLLCEHTDGMMIQEYLKGQEIGVDCYIDMLSGELISVFMKKKLVMRAGETDKAESFMDEKLLELVTAFVKEAGFRGQIDIDVFEVDGEYYISEVNPRFGGGYPHAYECGANHMKYIVNNLKGVINTPEIGQYQVNKVMMKYNEIMIKDSVQ